MKSELCKYCPSEPYCRGTIKCRKMTDIEATAVLPKKEKYDAKQA